MTYLLVLVEDVEGVNRAHVAVTAVVTSFSHSPQKCDTSSECGLSQHRVLFVVVCSFGGAQMSRIRKVDRLHHLPRRYFPATSLHSILPFTNLLKLHMADT